LTEPERRQNSVFVSGLDVEIVIPDDGVDGRLQPREHWLDAVEGLDVAVNGVAEVDDELGFFPVELPQGLIELVERGAVVARSQGFARMILDVGHNAELNCPLAAAGTKDDCDGRGHRKGFLPHSLASRRPFYHTEDDSRSARILDQDKR
jgi:hypothetical protein